MMLSKEQEKCELMCWRALQDCPGQACGRCRFCGCRGYLTEVWLWRERMTTGCLMSVYKCSCLDESMFSLIVKSVGLPYATTDAAISKEYTHPTTANFPSDSNPQTFLEHCQTTSSAKHIRNGDNQRSLSRTATHKSAQHP